VHLRNKFTALFKAKEDVKTKNRKYQIHPNNPESQAIASQALQDVKNQYRKARLSPANDNDSRMLRRRLRGEFRRHKIGLKRPKARPKTSGAKTRLRG